MIGWPEIVGILVVMLVLFGAKKVPELARGLGQGIREFKKATREVQDQVERAVEEEPRPAVPISSQPVSSYPPLTPTAETLRPAGQTANPGVR
ncbi:MAG: twin-arginine translocase TatA/TatE family subunit [Verrucomicrobia bacterium]|nr:twin-arginine translocase TatA/TatE family subunit [Verrucomicrobiota bacterium]